VYKGIYIAASGAILKQTQLEVVSQNIANMNTSGYKKDNVSFKEYLLSTEAAAVPDGRAMSDYSEFKLDLSNGTIIRTGNPLDIAIDGNGMIALENGRYTRRGDLKRSSEGYLTSHDGAKVLGANGPILLPTDSTVIEIDPEGKVSAMQQDTNIPSDIDTIRIVEFGPDGGLAKSGNGQFTATGAAGPSTSGVKQGYLETSNVDTVKEMIRMIDTMREYESYQKVIQMFDDATAKVNNEMGRI